MRKESWICEARILEFLAMQLDFFASHRKFLEPEDTFSICVLDCRRRFNLMHIRAHARESHLETSQAVCQRYAWPIWRSALGHGKAATRLLELRDWSGAVPLFAWLLQRYRMGQCLIRKQQPEAEVKGLRMQLYRRPSKDAVFGSGDYCPCCGHVNGESERLPF